MNISGKIFELIREKGMTQKEFGKRTGIPQSTISDWKSKKLNPSSDKILMYWMYLPTNCWAARNRTDMRHPNMLLCSKIRKNIF